MNDSGDRQEIGRADRCADIEKTNLRCSEARRQSEDCAKLHTLKSVENCPHFWEFIFGRPVPRSGLATGILADLRHRGRCHRQGERRASMRLRPSRRTPRKFKLE
jgi:hypothetical protein